MTTANRPVLIHGATVVSVDPSIGTMTRGDVLITGDTITAVGPDLQAEAGPDAVTLDARGMIALPGFVDAHVHAWEGQLRGAAAAVDFAG